MAFRRIVLVGAGHTNLHIVRMWMLHPIRNVGLTLISPFGNATYSGMLPGTLAGLYSPAEMEIDLYRLTQAAGVELIIDEAIGLDAAHKQIKFGERPPMSYDMASVGVGSVPKHMESLRTHPGFVSIKPMFTALQRLDAAIQRIQNGPVRTAIVGGGAAGVEVAFCVEHRIRESGRTPLVTLIDASAAILSGFRTRTIRLAEREFQNRGIDVRCGRRVTGHRGLNLLMDNEDEIPADVVIWVTGAFPPSLLKNIELPKAESGFLRVQNTLQSVGDPSVFVVGDSAEIEHERIDRAGVYAVRQGPILWENLNRLLSGRALVSYQPQRDFLRLLATGDGKAIGQWKWLSGIGTHWWKLKDRIDSRFMRMFRPTPAMMANMRKSNAVSSVAADTATDSSTVAMRCRGCGGKTSARVLQLVLQKLRSEATSPAPGFLQSDDTALLPDRVGTNAVSVDFFPAFIDDPWLTGRIAAIHSLSDLWASGVKPTSAVAMVTLPEGSLNQQSEMLYYVLSGAIRELNSAGAVLVGGHTTNGDELAVGFTVFGNAPVVGGASMSDKLPLSKGNLRPGQRLILTKPLGTGIILAAKDQGRGNARAMAAAISTMLQSNQLACELAMETGVKAATDVTGFGLAGHLLEMCQQSHVSVELNVATLPLISGAIPLVIGGVQSSLFSENAASVANFLTETGNTVASQELVRARIATLYDPQTSGGLLVGVDPENAESLVKQLITAGYTEAAIIGSVTEATDDPRILIKSSS
ncbi:MAG TPA: selenide, water dikinase SelD [Planctomycetaceae bacterium]|nr:selenide, water dikinase SelD [Planctomycetaceae bacterium]